ncbi:hypothetical protein JZ751_026249 [Albula glossodonta]|uniref:Uncharacterized protein n=1 Tax=Albula glossodonta TaxID=121402 RepID=A0A8T2PDV1_9TELE|nr:hypothetical protein JZ751_026249 [Albula glossodonta]
MQQSAILSSSSLRASSDRSFEPRVTVMLSASSSVMVRLWSRHSWRASNSTAFSYWECLMKKSEQRASKAGSEFSSRSSAISCSAPNCCVAKASSRALEKWPACQQQTVAVHPHQG